MYAIVEVAGKQYKVTKGLNLYVNLLHQEAKKKISLDKVLLINDSKQVIIGTPYIEGAVVKATVKAPMIKDQKVIVYKYKNKTGYHKKQGHRQQYTVLEIDEILPKEAKAKKVTSKTAETVKEEDSKKVTKAKTSAAKTPAKKTTAKKEPAKSAAKATTKSTKTAKSSTSKAKTKKTT